MPSPKKLDRFSDDWFSFAGLVAEGGGNIYFEDAESADRFRRHFYNFRSAVKREHKVEPENNRLRYLSKRLFRIRVARDGHILYFYFPEQRYKIAIPATDTRLSVKARKLLNGTEHRTER